MFYHQVMQLMMNMLILLKDVQQKRMLYDEHQIFPQNEYVLILLEQLNQVFFQLNYFQNDLQVLYELFEHYDLDDERQYLLKFKKINFLIIEIKFYFHTGTNMFSFFIT